MKVTPEEQDMIDLIAETERVEALLADLATAQAQVAVMAEAMEKLGQIVDDAWCTSSDLEMTDPWSVVGAIRRVYKQALSAAPKVVWSKRVEIREAATGEWTGLYDEDGYVGKLNGTIGEGLDGKWVTLFVLDKQGEGE